MKKRNFTTVLMLTLALAASAQVNIHIDIKQSKDNKTYDSVFVKSEAKLQTVGDAARQGVAQAGHVRDFRRQHLLGRDSHSG